MTAILFTATAEHGCHKCHQTDKTIRVGDKAVKGTGRQSSCGGSWATTVYYHEACFPPTSGRRGHKGTGVV